jgi:hypothetical protein
LNSNASGGGLSSVPLTTKANGCNMLNTDYSSRIGQLRGSERLVFSAKRTLRALNGFRSGIDRRYL